ncbi:hypothetical protein NEOLEDRAFT_1099538 [Neolentinus lepideus HHB14362 ss-1]|uniref:VWFA domain-containing protein n=1 Tax=Neolentinus lepideus HHB14362 ss-1 TaxID=1314782 RepID=A0A165PM11_9AGAM|nr:hypothetical protein NEOLEDRAFT_1099538 [Neolentinus lepideus HHB14362 ss-1]
MPLEATLMIIDNSEYMRNGDYQPTRFEAQTDAVTTIFQTKVDSNPESSVGLMTMAAKGPEVLVTHSRDIGQILQGIHKTTGRLGGTADIPTALNIAQLALKHRQNKNLRQRIILFVGSPLDGAAADEKGMVRLAKKLKKNNVAVDVVAFGDAIEEGAEGSGNVLKAFVDAASSGDNSHLVSVPPGPHLLSDIILTSAILAGDRGMPEPMADGGAGGEGAGGSNQFEFGVDPSLDPELAMALRMSMEEEQARQAAAQAAQQSPAPSAPDSAPTTTVPAEPTDEEEEAMLRQALAMSQEEQDVEMHDHGDGDGDEDEEMSEEEAIARAIEMSMQQSEQEQQQKK